MSQPVWQHVGSIGDKDPIAYGGGFIYEDTTGVYPSEVAWFEPAPDEEWHKTEGKTPLQVYRFILERDPESEWWWKRLTEVANTCDLSTQDAQDMACSTDVRQRAALYACLIYYFGAFEFDSDPLTMTEDEAYQRYATEIAKNLGREVR